MTDTKKMTYFNELVVDLNDGAFFSAEIYERTKSNPNPNASHPCYPCNDSLDEYASQLSSKILNYLKSFHQSDRLLVDKLYTAAAAFDFCRKRFAPP